MESLWECKYGRRVSCSVQMSAAIRSSNLHSFKCWNRAQIIVHSTSQHSATWWADWKLVRRLWEMGFWVTCIILCCHVDDHEQPKTASFLDYSRPYIVYALHDTEIIDDWTIIKRVSWNWYLCTLCSLCPCLSLSSYLPVSSLCLSFSLCFFLLSVI